MHYRGLRNDGQRALHEVCRGVGMSNFHQKDNDSSSHHIPGINRVIEQALEKLKLVVVIIDD